MLYQSEQKLMNGRSIGIIKAIVYKDKHGSEGPLRSKVQPAYVNVDFPSCEIPTGQPLIPGYPVICVPTGPVTIRCERKCCAATQIPLRVCFTSVNDVPVVKGRYGSALWWVFLSRQEYTMSRTGWSTNASQGGRLSCTAR